MAEATFTTDRMTHPLIGMLERPEGASVAQIGQRLGWLPPIVRASITGLRKSVAKVTRSEMPMTGRVPARSGQTVGER